VPAAPVLYVSHYSADETRTGGEAHATEGQFDATPHPLGASVADQAAFHPVARASAHLSHALGAPPRAAACVRPTPAADDSRSEEKCDEQASEYECHQPYSQSSLWLPNAQAQLRVVR
jgi:hypothetical protein